jgi:uncharacterized membrane protein
LAWVWPTSPDASIPTAESVAEALDAAVRIGFERTLEQDPGLGLRQLVDPACKALSPAVNDPYTAIQFFALNLGAGVAAGQQAGRE